MKARVKEGVPSSRMSFDRMSFYYDCFGDRNRTTLGGVGSMLNMGTLEVLPRPLENSLYC